MTSLVADFLVNPVIRQARRFSRSSNSINGSEPISPSQIATERRDSQGDVISETEEESYLEDGDAEGSAISTPSSRSSMHPNPYTDGSSIRGRNGEVVVAMNPTMSQTYELPVRPARPQEPDNQTEPMSAVDSNTRVSTESGRVSPADGPALVSTAREKIGRSSLPADDGMGALRKRIFSIQAQDLEASEKARLMHELLLEGYSKSPGRVQAGRPMTPSSPAASEQRPSQGPLESFKFWQNTLGEIETEDTFHLTDADIQPTFAPRTSSAESGEDMEDPEDPEDPEDEDNWPLGCEHYRRNVKLQCSTCNRWYTCRFCHDNVEDHALIRKDTKNMLCMFCGTAQRAGEACVTCGASAARYFCNICKLWNDDPDKPVYHCNDCGICRIGRGIGKDFFHCKKCCACISINKERDHRCIERATDCDCPICGDYMFTSPKAVCFMKCGHSIHRQCWQEHMKTSYKCPICNKSLTNMESQFRNLDIAIQTQPMPPEFRDTRAVVLCNDCSAKSSTPYHWLGLKCAVCLSYNTAQIQILGTTDEDDEDLVRQNRQVPLSATPGNPDSSDTSDPAGARDIRRRRHSSNVMSSTGLEPPLDPHMADRFARSVSPLEPVRTWRMWNATAGGSLAETEDEEEDQDMIGFWSRVPRSITSNDEDGNAVTDEESVSSSEEEEMEEDEGDDSDDDDFELLGHR